MVYTSVTSQIISNDTATLFKYGKYIHKLKLAAQAVCANKDDLYVTSSVDST